ncbi:MAG: TolB family protein, partial [Acidobacteriota bacterium]
LISPRPSDPASPIWRQQRWQLGSVLAGIGAVVVLYVTLEHLIVPPGDRGAQAGGSTVAMVASAEHEPLTFTGQSFGGELSPDGTMLAYIQRAGNWETHHLMLKDLTQDPMTSEPLKLFEAHRIARVRWSPLETELLVSAQIDNEKFARYLIPRLGGPARNVDGKTPGGWYSWAPDGKRYGVTKGKTAIHVVDIATGDFEEVPVEMPYTFLWDWQWSPAGDLLAFLGYIEGQDQCQILTMRADGGPMEPVYTGSKWLRELRWSGDGTSLYFLDVEGPISTLLRVSVDPLSGGALGEPEVMLSGLETEFFSLSRGGDRLVYDKQRSWSNLSVVTLGDGDDDRAVRTRFLTSGTYHDSQQSLSPDGSQIAFVRGNEPQLSAENDVFVVPLAGGSPRRLTFSREREGYPSWSPDGAWLAYGSDTGGATRVWKVAATGGSPQVFAGTELSATQRVTWAPDSHIAYQRPANRNYMLLDPVTGEQQPLLAEEERWIGFPQFSHDGTRVVARWIRESQRVGVWVLAVDGSAEHLIYEEDGEPVGWSADDAWIYIWDYDRKAIRVPAGGGEAEMLFQMPFEGQDGKCVVGIDESQWICAAGASTNDIWLVEDLARSSEL